VDVGAPEVHVTSGRWRVWAAWFALALLDLVASFVFWGALTYLPDALFNPVLGALLAAMVLWRLWHLRQSRSDALGGEGRHKVPYSCGVVSVGGKELFLVATVHISPRAPQDVKAVITLVKPDLAMIELDEERLDHLRDTELRKSQQAQTQDLQKVTVMLAAESEPVTMLAQRALWNAEHQGERLHGQVVFECANAYGVARPGEAAHGQLWLVHRGAPEECRAFAPFAIKAHHAAEAGAQAVFVINREEQLPAQRLGGGSLASDFRVAFLTRNCGSPSVPVLLLSRSDGERLKKRCLEGAAVRAELEVLPDSYPRRTLPQRLCQGCALMLSGIGVLYGVIQCCDVEVGAEFTEADSTARAQGIPCECIDVDMNRFWNRLGAAVLPTPCNLLASLLSWLAFPRLLGCVLFPPKGNVDVLGSMCLHAASFRLRTWVAFSIAGVGASVVATFVLRLLGQVSELGAEEAGAVSSRERDAAQNYIMLLIEVYTLPQVYQAVAAFRDEAMYHSIVAKSRDAQAHRLVAVVGAGHANGILRHARARGL